ncbi:MAG: cysteine hydrolase family protein [Christensenellales bacterium]|jgi:nicotinamidase-related amidase
MNKALIIIDFVYDFVADGGSLTCGAPAQAIDSYIANLAERYAAKGDFIFIARDSHVPGDIYNPQSSLFPTHCIAGDSGGDLYGETGIAVSRLPRDNVIDLPKTRYSAFAGTALDLKLRERGISRVSLAGVCTEICVLHTAIDAYNLGYNIEIHKRAVAGLTQEGHEFALNHFKTVLGAEVI